MADEQPTLPDPKDPVGHYATMMAFFEALQQPCPIQLRRAEEHFREVIATKDMTQLETLLSERQAAAVRYEEYLVDDSVRLTGCRAAIAVLTSAMAMLSGSVEGASDPNGSQP